MDIKNTHDNPLGLEMKHNGILKTDNEENTNTQHENVEKMPNNKNFTFQDKNIIDTFKAKNKIFTFATAFNRIRKLNLMRIVSGGQFGHEIMNNKEYRIQWNHI